jgi:hypothetical protein
MQTVTDKNVLSRINEASVHDLDMLNRELGDEFEIHDGKCTAVSFDDESIG